MTEVEQDVLEDTLVSAHDTVLTPPPSPCRDDSRESTDDEAVFEAMAGRFRSARAPATPLRSSEEEEVALERSISGLSLARPPRSPSPVLSEPRVSPTSRRNTPVRTAYVGPLSSMFEDDVAPKKLFDDKENVPLKNVRALDEWRSANDEDGDTYFYNRRTRRVAWELPRGAVTVEKDGVSRVVAPRDRAPDRSVDIERFSTMAKQAATMATQARATPRTPPRSSSPLSDLAAALREATSSTPERVFSPACKVAPVPAPPVCSPAAEVAPATPPPAVPEFVPAAKVAPATVPLRTPPREAARAAPAQRTPIQGTPPPRKDSLSNLRARFAARAKPEEALKPAAAVTPHDLQKPRRRTTPKRTPLGDANSPFTETAPPRVFCCYCGQPRRVEALNAHLASCPQRSKLASTPVEARLRRALRNHWAASPAKHAKPATPLTVPAALCVVSPE